MVRLYNRQGRNLQGIGVIQPDKPDKTISNAFGTIAETTEKLAKENYELGRAQLVSDVLQTAYTSAPDNPQEFNKLIKSGFEKGLQGLDDRVKDKVLKSADSKVKAMQAKVGDNLNKRLDIENTNRVLDLMNSTLNNDFGVYQTNGMLIDALINRDEESVQKFKAINKENYSRLKAIAQAKNMRGSYIIGNATTRNALLNGSAGMYDTLIQKIGEMDYQTLKDFDEKTFQDSKRMMAATGLSYDSYQKASNIIKQRRKELNEGDKRAYNAQTAFNSATMVVDYNPETMEELKKRLSEEQYEALEKFVTSARGKIDVNRALLTDEDYSTIEQFKAIQSVMASKDDGTADYPIRLIDTFNAAGDAIKKVRDQHGTTDELTEVMNNILSEAATNQMFADTMNLAFEEGTPLKAVVDSTGFTQRDAPAMAGFTTEQQAKARKAGYYTYSDVSPNKFNPQVRNWITTGENVINSDIRRNMRAKAKDGILQMAQVAMQLRNPDLSEDDKQSILSQVRQIRDYTNEQILKEKYAQFIPDWDRVVKEYKEKGKSNFIAGGDVYEFAGFASGDIILKGLY